ncbi:immunity 42 family protein [Paenibacillus sp. FSL L8-0436]|uniref:immunity 42 family protein n=1 Tax=Paenibacillus sp. FSL L8-0436 TaxID=2954686 RepID=UPI0031586624
MLIGDSNKFAIQFDLNADYGGFWMFGKFCYWINGIRIGDYESGTSLRDVLFSLESLVKDNSNRSNEKLFNLDAKECFNRLNEALYGDSNQYDSISIEESWARFNVCPLLDIFNDWKIFLVEYKGSARFLIRNLNSVKKTDDILEYIVQVREFETELYKTYELLSEIYENEIK